MYQFPGRCPELSQEAGRQRRPLADVHDPLGVSVPGHRGRVCWSKVLLLDNKVSGSVGQRRSIEINKILFDAEGNESDGSKL